MSAQVGPYMQTELRRRFADHPLVGEVRGVGLIAAIELVADKATHDELRPEARRSAAALAKLMEEHGVIGRAVVERLAVLQPAADHHRGARSTRCSTAPARRWTN